MIERRIGAALLTLLVGGIAGGFGGANLALADSAAQGKADDARPKKPAAKVEPSRRNDSRSQVR